jgi:dihydroorotate dehydrogenase (NAD+) catalytic subunit
MEDLSTDLLGIKLKNPLILASGLMGVSSASLKLVEKNGVGAVTLKSIGPLERHGHANPTIYAWEHGITNAVGLSNPGIDESLLIIRETIKTLKIPVIISVFADKIDNYVKIVDKLLPLNPSIIELNLSCPNTEDEFGKMFALDPHITEKVVRAVKKLSQKIKVFVKLTADASNIAEIAKTAETGGADGITAINTISGLIIDIRLRKPILTNKFGGISGPAIKPIAVRAVYNIYKAVKIPIIGIGGVMKGEDVVEFIMAGATAVGIGSGIYYRGLNIFKKATEEMRMFMKKEKIKNLQEIRGIAHEN